MKEKNNMIKVIETNLSLDENENILDHQSRVIEVESWDSFIEEIKNGETICRKSILGCLDGCSIPKKSKVENLIYDYPEFDSKKRKNALKPPVNRQFAGFVVCHKNIA